MGPSPGQVPGVKIGLVMEFLDGRLHPPTGPGFNFILPVGNSRNGGSRDASELRDVVNTCQSLSSQLTRLHTNAIELVDTSVSQFYAVQTPFRAGAEAVEDSNPRRTRTQSLCRVRLDAARFVEYHAHCTSEWVSFVPVPRTFHDMHATVFNLVMLALAGVAGASFAWPMKHFRGWRWEHVWIGQALTSTLAFPLLTLALLWPIFRGHMPEVPAGRLVAMVALGTAWGLGGIGYGLCLVLLGLSFTYSVIFSVTTVFGALLPMWIGLRARPAHLLSFGLGLALCVVGITVIADAAARREGETPGQGPASEILALPVPRLSYKTSLLLAVLAGFFSAAMGLALVVNEDLVNHLVKGGVSPVLAPLIVWVPLGVGSTLVALIFGLWCALRSASVRRFYQSYPLRNWLLVSLMGILGFGVLLLYGLGSTARGHPPRNVSWAVYMTIYILAGNAIGLLTREWEHCSLRTYMQLAVGIAFLLGAIVSLALS
jgi:L-rhamnose-H+ transport protein